MKLDYVVHYVADLKKTVAFYEEAFGLSCRLWHESDLYAEMQTQGNDGQGAVLGFAHYDLIDSLIGDNYDSQFSKSPPMQISFYVDDVDLAFANAVDAGAQVIMEPEGKPWGFRVAFVKDCNGFLVELCRHEQTH